MDDITIDGTKMVAEDIAKILMDYRMCDIDVETNSRGNFMIILDHTGMIIKRIMISEA